uniref:Monoterpene synthase n=1 Tax=Trachyspermum ammi TaxID=52570 RepID=A0A2H5BX72_TRAAM|nr:monoterpene synthase [Trachyspermum ammi]
MALACSPLITSCCNFGRDVIPFKSTKNTTLKPIIKSFPQTTKVAVSQEPVVRRSGDYPPCIWDYHFFQSLRTDYTGEGYNAQASELKEDVKLIFKKVVDPLDQLELIDHIQRLGFGYHFAGETKRTLEKMYNDDPTKNNKGEKNLHATALKFRLLREHGFHVSSEIFIDFTENEKFIESLGEDVKGILSLYEASYFSIEGESLMEEAHSFTSKILKECIKSIDDSDLGMLVSHALELPQQWRVPRLDARWYMDIYERSKYMIPEVLKFAKFDFNIVQGLNQDELKDVSRWWKGTDLGQKLEFIRDRLPTSFLWAVGISCNHQHGYFRRQITKVIQFITLLDDVYDVYGTLDELELFTSVVERWDINAMTELPHYMKLCFLSLNNLVSEIAYDVLNEQKVYVLPQLRKAIDVMLWIDLFKHYLVEARWYYSGYKPTFEEFLSNGLVTITGPVVVIYSYILTCNPIRKEATDYIESLPDIVRLASEIFRLADDFGTSSDELKRGDIPKSIQCYMKDAGVSEEVARTQMIDLMRKKWKQMMKCVFSGDMPLDWSAVEIILNMVRMSHCTYNSGADGYGVEDGLSKQRMFTLFTEPIPLLQELLLPKIREPSCLITNKSA